jgi:soluble lytic murein transglycosylase
MRRRFLLGVAVFGILIILPSLRFSSGPEDGLSSETRQTYLFLKQRLDLDDEMLMELARLIKEESARNHIDYRLVLALIQVESNFDAHAVSEMGARGLLQIKPSLARFLVRELDIEWKGPHTLHDPKENLRIGIHFLSTLKEQFGNLEKALLAYNVGPTRLRDIVEAGGISDRSFARKVMREYRKNILLLPDPEKKDKGS